MKEPKFVKNNKNGLNDIHNGFTYNFASINDEITRRRSKNHECPGSIYINGNNEIIKVNVHDHK